jgi:hypothetical protein
MTCPCCGEDVVFNWRMDYSGEEWAECTQCGALTDQQEIDAANREDLPALVLVKRAVHMPQIPEWEFRPTRIDISVGMSTEPGVATPSSTELAPTAIKFPGPARSPEKEVK